MNINHIGQFSWVVISRRTHRKLTCFVNISLVTAYHRKDIGTTRNGFISIGLNGTYIYYPSKYPFFTGAKIQSPKYSCNFKTSSNFFFNLPRVWLILYFCTIFSSKLDLPTYLFHNTYNIIKHSTVHSNSSTYLSKFRKVKLSCLSTEKEISSTEVGQLFFKKN